MKPINSIPALPELQYCDTTTFFDILSRIDLTTLTNATTGPERQGPKLKEPDAVIRLCLWHLWCLSVNAGDPHTVAGLHRELEDPQSELLNLCRFDPDKKLPVQRTISNHLRRILEHPDPVRDVLSTINDLVAYTPLDKPSSAAKKAGNQDDRRNEREPKNRNKENIAYRSHRRQEAVGDREFKPIVDNEASAEDWALKAIHGDRPKCHICPSKQEQGWTCTKDHVHGVVVEVTQKPGQSRQWKCHCCGYKPSITPGTAFHGTRFSCQEILIVLRYMIHVRCGISAQDVAGFLNEDGRNVSEGAARMLMHRLRECMREKTFEHFKGENELDEMLLRLNDGKKVSILAAYNRPTGRVRFKIIERKGTKKPKANQREMLQFIRETTAPDSIILTDGDAAIPKPGVMKRKHGSVNHKRFQFLKYSDLGGVLNKSIEVTSNRVEGKYGFVRRALRIRNGISRDHLERYLIEAAWRINHLHNSLESQNHDRDERRNLTLMRGVLAGAAGRKITLRDLRGEPQQKRDTSSKRNRTAPVSSHDVPKQPVLLPPGPIVPGASQSESGQIEAKPEQTRPAQVPRPEEDVTGSKPAPSGPPEESEQVLAA